MREDLLKRVDHAIALATSHHKTNALHDLKSYRYALESEDPLAFVLVRNFATNLCKWIEQRTVA